MTKNALLRKTANRPAPPSQQQIAVFGTARSGKTTLLSAFYGATQDPHYLSQKPYAVTADNQGEAAQLYHNYTALRHSGDYPAVTTRLHTTAHTFTVLLREQCEQPQQLGSALSRNRKRRGNVNPASAKPFQAMRLTWHDYPGEWLEETVTDPVTAQHRAEVFRSLLGAQVAVLLVDGAKLRQHQGNEGTYLRQLLQTYATGLLQMRDEVLPDGKPLQQFPRIWIFALSKADLLPQVDVHQFRQLLLGNASTELTKLRNTIASFVTERAALSVGEDFLLLSAVAEHYSPRVLLPLAAMLPFERHLKWAERLRLPAKAGNILVQGAGFAALALLSGKIKVLPAPLTWALSLLGSAGLKRGIEGLGRQLQSRGELSDSRARALSQALTGFQAELQQAETARALLLSEH